MYPCVNDVEGLLAAQAWASVGVESVLLLSSLPFACLMVAPPMHVSGCLQLC
jgi:hypothetical protein